MANANHSETHPLARLGVEPSEIEKRTGARALRPNIWAVLHRRRDRLGWDAYSAIKDAFPEFALDEAMKWKWSEHKVAPKPKKSGARHGVR